MAERVADLLCCAGDAAPSERQSFLDSASSDPEIISEVLLLLEQSERHAPERMLVDAMHAVGSQVSRYVVLSELGRGGMGQVFSARHRTGPNVSRNS